MTINIVYTQDVPGEREWLSQQFPGFINLETVHSGLWSRVDSSVDCLLEIPESDDLSVRDVILNWQDAKTYTSIYQPGNVLSSCRWTESSFVVYNGDFSCGSGSETHYNCFTFTRAGTVFLESLFVKKYKMVEDHSMIGNSTHLQQFYDTVTNASSVVVIPYRNNWWEWITSSVISEINQPINVALHYDSRIDFNNLRKVKLNESIIENYYNMAISSWEFICNLRSCLPHRKFYVLEFSDMISKYQSATTHKKIPYDKKSLIEDYDRIKELFDLKFKEKFKTIELRAVNHLKQMECLTDLDFIV